jgi:hypothetical protein
MAELLIILLDFLSVPQNTNEIEICLRITRQTTTLHLLIWVIVVAPLLLAREN